MNLFFIGEAFYNKSGSSMSSIYEVNTFRRMDWGKVKIALSQRKKVTIRPANIKELRWAYAELNLTSKRA